MIARKRKVWDDHVTVMEEKRIDKYSEKRIAKRGRCPGDLDKCDVIPYQLNK
jgi:hypothetical protein